MNVVRIIKIVAAGVLGSTSELGVPNNPISQGSISRIVNLVFSIAGSVAVISVIVGGILYALSTGDSAKVAQAKNTILYSVIGLLIVASAFLITNFIIGRF